VMIKLYLIVSVMAIALYAEPTLGILKAVLSNNVMRFSIDAQPFTCKNYGIVTLDEIQGLQNTCNKLWVDFQHKQPYSRYATQQFLKRYQQYHLEILPNNRCLVYAKGKKTLSELLLEQGVAIREHTARNRFVDFKLKRAVRRARNRKRGIYAMPLLRSCIGVLE